MYELDGIWGTLAQSFTTKCLRIQRTVLTLSMARSTCGLPHILSSMSAGVMMERRRWGTMDARPQRMASILSGQTSSLRRSSRTSAMYSLRLLQLFIWKKRWLICNTHHTTCKKMEQARGHPYRGLYVLKIGQISLHNEQTTGLS